MLTLLKKRTKILLARMVTELLTSTGQLKPGVDVEVVERVLEALLGRLDIAMSKGNAGKCSRCTREVRILLADIANTNDRRCIRCSPAGWLDLFCSNIERTPPKAPPDASTETSALAGPLLADDEYAEADGYAGAKVDTTFVRCADGTMELRLRARGPHVGLTTKDDVDALSMFVTALIAKRIAERPPAS